MNRFLLLVDNYDSFTWNLVTVMHAVAQAFRVVRNDAITLEEIEIMNPCGVLLSPGPGRPEQAGITPRLIPWAAQKKVPLLGICLGHQALGQGFGAQVVGARQILHGKASRIRHDGSGLFAGLPDELSVGRYHSLAVRLRGNDLLATAWSEDGEIMGLRHRHLPLEGVQFHPESVLTPEGPKLLANFARLCGL